MEKDKILQVIKSIREIKHKYPPEMSSDIEDSLTLAEMGVAVYEEDLETRDVLRGIHSSLCKIFLMLSYQHL